MLLEFSPLCLQSFKLCTKAEKLIELCDAVHLDYMDKEFVPPSAFSVDQINTYKTKKDKHVHLMCLRPDIIAPKIESVQSISAHIEVGIHFDLFVSYMHSTNINWGVVISPKTSLAELEKLKDKPPSRIVVMAVQPGFSGQTFIESTYSRIKKIKEMFPESNIVIDGGINTYTAKMIKEIGVHSCVICSALVKSKSKYEYVQQLKSEGALRG